MTNTNYVATKISLNLKIVILNPLEGREVKMLYTRYTRH